MSTTSIAPRVLKRVSPTLRSRARSRAKDFFYAPDPSSQLACTLAGNLAMNSGGAHGLKYGVTTNNVLGLKMVLIDGTVAEFGGGHLDAPGYDFLSLIIGSEGQFGIITEATVRILRKAEGARPMLIGFQLVGSGRRVRLRHHRGRHHSCRHRIHGQARDPRVRSLLLKPDTRSMSKHCSLSRSKDRRQKSKICLAASQQSRASSSQRALRSAGMPTKARRSGPGANPLLAPSAGYQTTTAWTARYRSASCRTC